MEPGIYLAEIIVFENGNMHIMFKGKFTDLKDLDENELVEST